MIVGIDGNEANVKNRVGVHQMAFKILWGLFKLGDNKNSGIEYIIYLKESPNPWFPPEKKFWKYKILRGERVWILTKLLPELVIHPRANIFFTPSHYLPPILTIPTVCMITDLGYLKFSGQFKKYDFWQLKYWTAISLIISKYIIAISNSTQQDIVRHYSFCSKKVESIYLGPDLLNYNKNISEKFVRQTLKKYRISKKYFVFMSTLKPSKNIEGLLEAFSLVRKKYSYQLVVVGKKGWLFETIFRKTEELGLNKDVIFTDYLYDKERAAILRGSKAFVLPSFWEGFGIDILNSFSCRVPVVVSRAGSLPEVAGEAGIYVDPKNISSITSGMEKVIKMSTKEYNEQVKKGFLQLNKFSWEKTAKQVLKVLVKAYNN